MSAQDFNFEVVDEFGGVTYTPWTNGYAIGFKVTHRNGDISYVYFNPSVTDGSCQPDVFVYTGSHGDATLDDPECFITTAFDGIRDDEET